MKAVEFETTMTRAGQIDLPLHFASDVPEGRQLKVIVMWDAESSDVAWRAAGYRRFEQAYSPEDAVYEQLLDETPGR